MKRVILLILMLSMTLWATSDAKKVRYMESVKDIIVAAQKTRGGTYNFLNGSEFAQFGVYEQRTKMKQAFKALNRQFKVVGGGIDSEFDKLYKQIKSLNKLAFELDPLTSFKAYSMLINKMIVLGNKVQVKLYGKADAFEQQVSKVMMSDILRVTEGLGKLRGLGSGIAARTEIEEEEVDYLKVYIAEIKLNLNKMILNMARIDKKTPGKYPGTLTKELQKYKGSVEFYISFAEDNLLESDPITIDSNKYFKRGTELISEALDFYEMNAALLK